MMRAVTVSAPPTLCSNALDKVISRFCLKPTTRSIHRAAVQTGSPGAHTRCDQRILPAVAESVVGGGVSITTARSDMTTVLVSIMRSGASLAIVIALCTLTSLSSDALAQRAGPSIQPVFDQIGVMADRICLAPPMSASGSSSSWSGALGIGLSKLLKIALDLNLSGAGKYASEVSTGVAQRDLGEVVKNTNNCKLAVFNALQEKLIPALPPATDSNPSKSPVPTALASKAAAIGLTGRQLAERGNNFYYGRNGYPLDYDQATKWFAESAKRGDAEGQSKYARDVLETYSSKSMSEARRWYDKAAAQNYPDAFAGLALLAMLEKNDVLARQRVMQAVNLGSAEGMYRLGMFVSGGQAGYDQDAVAGQKWFVAAAEKGYGPAAEMIGLAYAIGEGATKNETSARAWFARAFALDKGADGECLAGWSYEREGHFAEALQWYKTGAQQPYHSVSKLGLGRLFEDGNGVARSDVEAVSWYLLSAAMNQPSALEKMGSMYEAGRGGLSPSVAEATEFYKRAAQHGHGKAQEWLGVRGISWK